MQNKKSTTVNIYTETASKLNDFAKKNGKIRTAILTEAVEQYLEKQK